MGLITRFLSGWAGLARFWAVIAALVGATGLTLHLMGPPAPRPQTAPTQAAPTQAGPAPGAPAAAAPGQPDAGKTAAAQPAAEAPAKTQPPARAAQAQRTNDRPGRDTPGPIADPDPALLEASPLDRDDQLPRIAADGRKAMQVYAAGFDTQTRRARVSLILAGIGMHESDSLHAARTLPGGVTFAVSPYATNPERMLSAIRLAGHEYLLSLPMEPTEFPLSDPGPQALMTSLTPEQNRERLFWALSRMGGFVGATNALGGMRGERFSGMADQMELLQRELDKRGLLFVDVRADAGPNRMAWHRSVDLVIDDITAEDQIDQRLEALSRLARDRGTALGLASAPRTVTVDRIAAWANGLVNKGLALAPVSAIANPPAAKDPPK